MTTYDHFEEYLDDLYAAACGRPDAETLLRHEAGDTMPWPDNWRSLLTSVAADLARAHGG